VFWLSGLTTAKPDGAFRFLGPILARLGTFFPAKVGITPLNSTNARQNSLARFLLSLSLSLSLNYLYNSLIKYIKLAIDILLSIAIFLSSIFQFQNYFSSINDYNFVKKYSIKKIIILM
jgi:hypothetical protein